MLHTITRILALSIISCLFSHMGQASQTAHISPKILHNFTFRQQQRIIIQLQSSTPYKHIPLSSLQSIKSNIKTNLPPGVSVLHEYSHLPLMAMQIEEKHLPYLSHHQNILRIYADAKEEAQLDNSVPFIGASRLHAEGLTGEGVSIAILDTPISYWNAVFSNCPSQGNFYSNAQDCPIVAWENVVVGQDAYELAKLDDHGTHVAATVNAVAPGSKIIGLNVFHWNEEDQKAYSYESDQIAALNWIASNQNNYQIVAVNLSVGGTWSSWEPCNDNVRYEPIHELMEIYGVAVFAASGNQALSNQIMKPACLSAVTSIGAAFDSDIRAYSGSCDQEAPQQPEIACFTNLNGMLDFVAPGVFIEAAQEERSGTSQATPHASAAYALFQSQYLADHQEILSPYWALKNIHLRSMTLTYNNWGFPYLYSAKDFEPQWEYAKRSHYIDIEQADYLIPQTPNSKQLVINVQDQTMLSSGVYLWLDIVHPSPEQLSISLQNPNGQTVSFSLPDSFSNFRGIIGKHLYPGIFDDLVQSSINGNWSISITDASGNNRGYIMSSALFWTDENCTPQCNFIQCGDNLCGSYCGTCSDDLFCNGLEVCSLSFCYTGELPCPEDGLACTITCDEDRDSCQSEVREDGYCVIDNACYADNDANSDNTCQYCQSTLNANDWLIAENGTACLVTNLCIGYGQCENGMCNGGQPITCDDFNLCTDDSCDPTQGCIYQPNNLSCEDGNLCTTNDQCLDGLCIPGLNKCDDQNQCTQDACDELSGICSHTPIEGSCDDQDPCSEDDYCKNGRCTAGKQVCDSGCSCKANHAPLPLWLLFVLLFFVQYHRHRV